MNTLTSALTCSTLPTWYSSHRVHAHTRLSILDYCYPSDYSGWSCTPLFDNAAAALSKLNVKAYVRHTHSHDEGTWWPSTSDPPEAWHPMIRATNRSLPAEFLTEAAKFDMNVIAYHYMKTNAYYSKTHPEWVQRWPNGSAVQWARGVGLSPCSVPWQDTFIRQVVQLVEMGFTAFYFDEYPASKGGDWSAACKERFRQLHGVEMPTELAPHNDCEGRVCQPKARDRRVIQLQTAVTEEFFARLSANISAANPNTAALVSIFRVPSADNGGTLYETTQLLSPPNVVAKTEDHVPAGVHFPVGTDPIEDVILKSFGYSLARDAAIKTPAQHLSTKDVRYSPAQQMSPAHLWIPRLDTSQHALCSAAVMVAFGAIANPDHDEKSIPDFTLFNETYALGAKLSQAWARLPTLHPLRSAVTIFFSESARDATLPGPQAQTAWDTVLWPTLGAWRALVRQGLPSTLLVDWQLLAAHEQDNEDGYRSLVARHPLLLTPPSSALTPPIRAALVRYKTAGGALMELNASVGAWDTSSARASSEKSLRLALAHRTGAGGDAPPARVRLYQRDVGGPAQMQAYETPSGDALLLFALNNFTNCYGGASGVRPAPMRGLSFVVQLGGGGGGGAVNQRVRSAVDVLTGEALPVTTDPSASVARIALPAVEVIAAVEVRLEGKS